MTPFASVGFILAVAMLTPVQAVPEKVPLGCFTDAPDAPIFPAMASGIEITNTTTPTGCATACIKCGFIYAAMSEGIHCLCSLDLVGVPLLTAATDCDAECDGEPCGSLTEPTSMSIYDTGGGSPNFTLAVATDNVATIDLTVVPDATGSTFLVDYGYGSPLSYFNSTANMLGVPVYLVPGQYEVVVVSMIEGTPYMSVQSDTLIKTDIATSVDLVECPIVFEPDLVYYCNISATPKDENSLFVATFDNDGTAYDILGAADYYRLGIPPPRSMTRGVLAPASDTNVIMVVDHPITVEGKIIAFDMYAYAIAAFTISMKRPTCASGFYCFETRGCMEVCPYEVHTNIHTCAAPQWFCPGSRTCSDAGGADTCQAPEAAPLSWDDVPGTIVASSFAAVGFHRETLAAPVLLLPGDVLHVTGPIGRAITSAPGGDEVDGVQTTAHHLVSAIIKENVPVQVAHICTEINVDINLDVVDSADATILLNNHTSCERNITDIAMIVNQIETETFDPTLNLAEPYYIRTITPAIFTAIFSVAGPTIFTYSYVPDYGVNHTFEDSTDYPLTGVPYEVPHTISILPEGVYTVTISAENQHNIIPGPVTNQVTLLAQHEVVPTWTVAANSPLKAFHIPKEDATFLFVDTAGANFPTNATARCDFGDGTPIEELPFVNPGDKQPILSHTYTDGNVYTVTVYIYNVVSGFEVTCDVLIVEQIFDFTVTNKYFPNDLAVTSREGFGMQRNQFPMDRNLTFYPDMSFGTVDTYEIEFTGNNSQIFTYDPVDRFNPLENYFYYHFNLETLLNLTVIAVNIFERIPVDIFAEILEQVKIAQIIDYELVTEKEEEKSFDIIFATLGGGACMIVNWGDVEPIELHSYGDEYNCMLNFSYANYHDTPLLSIENSLTHVYMADGVYNISVMAYNPVSTTSDMLMFLVTSIKCRPPKVEVFDGTLDYLASPRLHKGEDNPIGTEATLDCEVTSKTKKRWQIYEVDSLWGHITLPILTMDAVETWNMSEIIIPANYLTYGHYMLTYTLTMWRSPMLDDWPFQKQADTFIEIIPTPIIPIMFLGGVMRITRGLIQTIIFDPSTNSIDPDFPDQKNFTVSWRCRSIDELWPADDTTPNPIFTKGSGGGCFGHGAGLLDYDGGNLTLLGSDFIAVDKIYEIEATLSKDTRSAVTLGQVEIVSYVPPIIETKCLVDSLCKPDGDGVYINPSLKMGLIAECIDYCVEPHDFRWKAMFHGSESPVTQGTEHFVVGDMLPDFAIAPPFFDIYESEGLIKISVEATNADGAVGGAMYFMKINQRPINGVCSVVEPATRLALVDRYHFECSGWVDPENKGISLYSVFSVTPDGTRTPLTDVKYSSAMPNTAELVLPPGTFDIVVQITDVWDAFTIYTAISGTEVLMPTQEQVEAADISGLIAELAGAGNTALLTMVIAAQTAVTAEAPWLSLAEEDIKNLSREELDARLVAIAKQNNAALDAIKENTNYNTLGTISAAAAAVAGMLEAASMNLETHKTIDIEARDKIADISEDCLNGLLKLDVPSSDLLIPLITYMGTIATGMSLGQGESGSKETCQNAPPNDVLKANKLPFDTRVTGLDMVIPENPTDILRCNVRDITKERAARLVPLIEKVLDHITESTLKRMVTGESYSVSAPNGVYVKIALVLKLDEIPIGISGARFIFPENFCPQGSCSKPVGYSCREWPFITHSYPDSAENLSPGTKILDLILYDRDTVRLIVKDLEEEREIKIDIPRSAGKMGNNTLPEFEYIDAVTESANQILPTVYTTFNISKNDASVDVEIIPEDNNPRLFLLISKPRLPTVSNHEFFILVKDIPETDGIHKMFVPTSALNGTGRYFLGIGEFKEDFNVNLMNDPEGNNVTGNVVQQLSTNYKLRIITSGCYYFNKKEIEWASDGLSVSSSDHKITKCSAKHLTSFGTGMFVMPNTIDFSYVFANMGFSDNLTIYLTLIISLSIFLLLMIWARFKDRKDIEKLGATPLPDNKVDDKYFYELLVFTGNMKSAQTDSIVQFIVTGDEDETDVRTLADPKRKILRKGEVDIFVMAVPRPLGSLNFLRIWHDNSGKGPNASWNLSYMVFRDVQSGDKYEFIANQWLAVEYDDGQIDRMLQVAGKAEKTEFSHLYTTTKNRNIVDGHLWFSVFLRPARSRFTRCQRVVSCFALLFLSMLVNAMWYDQVPEQPGTGGLNIGPFSLSPEQIGVGLMSNLIVFPPSFLIVFFFRKSRPKTLRKSRIEKAYEETRKGKESNQQESDEENENKDSDDEEQQAKDQIMHKKVIHKKEKNKKCTLPWWCKYVAWLLALFCIAISCFFLLMYGIMFGNSKATKWITSLVISFFSSILFIEPLKIFLTAMLVSAIFKSVDLDEDDADEDEEEPNLEQDEMWLHKGEKCEKNYKQRKVDNETLRQLRIVRKKEMEMWDILKEILFYSVFLWILLILSYGNRDPNAFFMQKGLREGFLHEGAFDGTDYTLVNNADKLWRYLFTGLMTDLRADFMYNGVPPYGLRGFFNDWCNRIMGYAIIRQIRIEENTCRIPYAVRGLTSECRGFSTLVHEDSRHYCEGWVFPTNATKDTPACNVPEFKYETADQLNSLPIWGQRDWYGGGGYVFHLKEGTAKIYKKMRELQEKNWIDSKTRAVLIEFSSYNSQVNLFGLSLIMAEFTPGGGITPSFRFEGIRLLQHHNNFGFFIICCEVAFVLFVLYFTVKELRLFCKQGRHYFDTYWSYAEIAIITASYLAILMYILRYVATAAALEVFSRTLGNGYVRMQYAASLDEAYGYLVGFIVFVGTIKFSKLLRFNKRIGVLSATLHQCWDDLSGFLMAFFLCFFSFVFMFFVLLNISLDGFNNFITAVETCFSMMLGKFQFEKMKQASMMVPIMFFVFVLFNSWVLINLLLTLIIKAFQQVKNDIMKQPNEYEMVAFIWGRFREFLGMNKPLPAHGPLVTSVKTKQEDIDDNKVKELPSKVDKFLDYLNNVYFAGSLDVNNRDALKSSFYRNQMARKATGILGDKSAYPSGGRGPKSGLGSGLNSGLGATPNSGLNNAFGKPTKNDWRGALDDDSAEILAKKKEKEKQSDQNGAGNDDQGPKYEGPRVSNKFQADLDDI